MLTKGSCFGGALGRNPHASDFYKGEVARAFNDSATCEQKFRKILATEPKSKVAQQVRHILGAVALREGRYARALGEVDSVLALDPNDGDAKASRPLLEALDHFPDQEVRGNSTASLQMDEGKLPILINGEKASYFFDTGANLSVLTESEATHFGMEIKENKSGVSTDINGNSVSYRVALANSVAVGGVELRNVVFLVSGNDQQPFVDMKAGQRGLIWLPVLRALGSITWSRKGAFHADRSSNFAKPATPNIFFDDLDVITQASFEGHKLPFILGTGAATSELWPQFASVAGDLVSKSGTSEIHTVMGMGGTQKFEVIAIPEVDLKLGGLPVALRPAHILKTQQRDAAKWFFGNPGMDLLGEAQSVTIDFRRMTLVLSKDAKQSISEP